MTLGHDSKGPASARNTIRIRLDGTAKARHDGFAQRLNFAAALCVAAFLVLAVRLFDVSVIEGWNKEDHENFVTADTSSLRRGDIQTENGVLLATDLKTQSLYAEIRWVRDPNRLARRLLEALPSLDREKVVEQLGKKGGTVLLERHLTPDAIFTIHQLGEPALHFRTDHRRLYPQGHLVAHAVGYTDIDNKPLAGAEHHFDARLTGSQPSPVHLTLNVSIQHIVREELISAVDTFRSDSAAGIVLDVRNGAVKAMVSLPDFDPNKIASQDENHFFNTATLGIYEMGSTFKAFTTAIALDSGSVALQGGYDASKPFRVGRYLIRDFHPENRWLSVAEILMHSSNIGAAQMAIDVGAQKQKAYLAAFGLLDASQIEVPEITPPKLPPNWGDIYLATISFGHGMSVSPVQTAAAFGALVNGGTLFPATLDAETANRSDRGQTVISQKTSRTMRQLLRLVVEKGTGGKAEAPGYLVAGKTGTAEKPGSGGYDRKRLVSSFAAAFPADDPAYVVLVLLDEPKGTPETSNYATGGWTAAPTVGRIIQRLGPLVGISPRQPDMFESTDGPAEYVRVDGDEIRLASF